jgi:molybdopterin synthase sulfur carrier subunit
MWFLQMQIRVRFFAALREQLGVSERDITLERGATVAQVWLSATGKKAMPDNVLAARNMEYVDASCPVADGDEVAFFPPVTGGAA